MLPRRHRIIRSNTKNATRPHSRSRSEYLQCSVFVQSGQVHATRFSISVGKQVSKSAVVRNAMRRRVTAVIERHIAEFRQDLDIHVRIVKNIRTLSPRDLEGELFHIFQDARTFL